MTSDAGAGQLGVAAALGLLTAAAIVLAGPVIGSLLIPLVLIAGAVAHIGLSVWRRYGNATFVITLVAFEAGIGEIIYSSPLFQNAVYSQPALRAQAGLVGAALAGVVAYLLLKRSLPLPRLGRLAAFEVAIVGLAVLAVSAAAVGLALGNDPVFLVGDTYRLLLVPLIWLLTVWLVADRRGVEAVLVTLALAALFGLCFSLLRVAQAFAAGGSTYGQAISAAPLLAIVGLLVLAYRPGRITSARATLLAAAVASVFAVNLLSLSRNQLLSAAVVVVAFFVLARGRAASALALVAAVGAALALVGAVLAPGVAAQVGAVVESAQERVSEAAGRDAAAADPRSSIGERRVEVEDSWAALSAPGPASVLVGRGSGAEYRSRALSGTMIGTERGFRHQIHVTWASVLFRTGVAGLAVVATLLASAIWTAWHGARRAGSPRDAVLWGSIALWLVVTAVGLNFSYGLIGELVWGVMLGLLSVLARTRVQAGEA